MGPEPIAISGFPNSPERYEAEDRSHWTTTYATVRDFFSDVEGGMKRFVTEFEDVNKEAHEALSHSLMMSRTGKGARYSVARPKKAPSVPIATFSAQTMRRSYRSA
jgi:hypothetical protein